MDAKPLSLITVSREFGAGGSDVAQELGGRLNWPVLDHDIVHLVAEQLRCEATVVEHLDEHPPSLMARIATVLVVPQSEMYSFPPFTGAPSHDEIATATHRVIQDAGASPPLIVVGHGAQCIFAGRPGTLHLRVIAPVDARVQRTAARMNINPGAAAALIQHADHDRQAYVQRYFHRDWRSELLYHLQINTGVISIDEAAAIVTQIVNGRYRAAE